MIHEIDLHGFRLEEALQVAEDFVLDNYYKNAKTIKIIHGKGNGILQMAIRDMLDTLKNERKIRLKWKESDSLHHIAGETIVEFWD